MGNAESEYARYAVECNQSTSMKTFSVQTVAQVHAKHNHFKLTNSFGELPTYEWTNDDQAIMDEIVAAFRNEYGGSWTCLSGTDVTYGVSPRPNNFIRFDIDKTGVGDLMNSKRNFCRIFIYQN